MPPKKQRNEELREKLKDRLGEKRISRSGKLVRKAVFDKTMSDMGFDAEKFQQDLEAVKKQGGVTIDKK